MKKCIRGFEVKVLKSHAGEYIGTEEDGCPNCRVSENYYDKKGEAQKRLDGMNFNQRGYAMEIQFCNGYQGCQIEEV